VNTRERIRQSYNSPNGEELLSLVPLDRIYEASAAPKSPQTPYIVNRFLSVVRISGIPSRQKLLQTWVHDQPGTYVDIEAILRATLAPTLAAVGETDTGWISDISWEGESEDLYDDATQTIVRYATYRLTGTGV
jgi:hypothetical protein